MPQRKKDIQKMKALAMKLSESTISGQASENRSP